jgi:hypothetical protein
MTKALAYIQDWLAETVWACSPRLWQELPLAYGQGQAEDYLPQSGFLSNFTCTGSPPLGWYEAWPCPFWTGDEKALLPFDVFAACVFLLSRYEEYQAFEPDAHGRFPLKAAWVQQHGVADYPIVQIWAELLRQALLRRWPRLEGILQAPRPLTPQYSYDIDLAFAYRHKPLWRQGASLVRHLLRGQWATLREQLAVLSGQKPDPYDTFSLIQDFHAQRGDQPWLFWLLGDYGPYDKNIAWTNPALQAKIRQASTWARQGLHPSYASNAHLGQLAEEKRRLQTILGGDVQATRQHYLKLRFPDTYRNLLAQGFSQDYTLGFAQGTGYRAGTNLPFFWFDWQRQERTTLLLQPFVYMDTTFIHYLSYTPDQALAHICELQQKASPYGGPFYSLWHNNTLENLAWRKIWSNSF